ncbi:hypothetical protein GCM10009756_21170 [Pseudokineococcus marinus]|uniref:hypothetical protein n=1 Tax=Pseudokineococcus marinus TaxID=351215 RepID=UPI0031D51C16
MRDRRGSWLGRLEAQLRRHVGPAQLGRSDEPDAERRREAQASRDAHAAAFEVVVDSSGRRYVRARSADPRGGDGDGPVAGQGDAR